MSEDEKVIIRNSKRFSYSLNEGSCCMIDGDVLNEFEEHYYNKYIDKIGVVIKIYSDMHVFGGGSIYQYKVSFGDEIVDGIFAEILKDLNCISLEYYKKIDSSVTKELLEKKGFSVC